MMFLSPRQDALKRGFIPCTEKFVTDLNNCQRGGIGCLFKYLGADIKCNILVVGNGFKQWISGKQKTPWSNYLFVPLTAAELDEQLPYEGNVIQDMENLEQQRLFIEQKHQELEAAKQRSLQLNQDVLLSTPETNDDNIADFTETSEPENIVHGDIADEAFLEDIDTSATDNSELPVIEPDIVKSVRQKNAIVLKKGEFKDEK
ncbi:MAG: hypothetical protein ILA52_02340 [Alphaproteobacteria bacterium]|nr:hypothetical protein [Alphaproteobacteria bacterium]